MPRIIVTTTDGGAKLLDEGVIPDHLEDEHSSLNLLERIAWAISDAEDVELGKRMNIAA